MTITVDEPAAAPAFVNIHARNMAADGELLARIRAVSARESEGGDDRG